MSKFNNAIKQSQKAVKWLLISGTALTALNAVQVSLQALQGGEIEADQFLTGLVYTIAFMLVNTAIYFIHEYKE